MANVQTENGYTTIANDLIEAMAGSCVAFSGRQLRVLLAIARRTYGWRKKTDRISASQIAEATRIDARHVRTVLADLEAMNAIGRSPMRGGCVREVWIQKDFDRWKPLDTDTNSHDYSGPDQSSPGRNGHDQNSHRDPDQSSPGDPDQSGHPQKKGKKTKAKVLRSPASPAESDPPKPPKPNPGPPDWALDTADHLIKHVRQAKGGRIPPRARRSWALEIAKLRNESDELAAMVPDPADHLRTAIDWLFSAANTGQGRYALVVRCGASLREKWPRIVAAAWRVSAESPEAVESARQDRLRAQRDAILGRSP